MSKKKLTLKIALFGTLGAGALAYAFMRRPRYMYDGTVAACEGSTEEVLTDGSATWTAAFRNCRHLYLMRGANSGKIFAPFEATTDVTDLGDGRTMLTLRSVKEPLEFQLFLEGGTASVPAGSRVKSGSLIGQAARVEVGAFLIEGANLAPMAPSTWLIANALLPAKHKGSKWCEDSHQVVVPSCTGPDGNLVSFRAPTMAKWSLRSIRMTM